MANRHTIRDVANLLGISTDAIRLYEKEGLVTPLRDPQNDYRYYGTYEIQRIMAICLYRQLDVSLSDIKELLKASNFPEIIEGYGTLISNTESEIQRLQNQIDKLRFMENHLKSLHKGHNTCSIQELPPCYILFQQDASAPIYATMRYVINSPIFSFGNFCYSLKANDGKNFQPNALEFMIREPMMRISPCADRMNSFPHTKGHRCIYTVTSNPINQELHWNLDLLLDYAKEHNYQCAEEAYAFYVFSLSEGDSIIDYYEIFLPII